MTDGSTPVARLAAGSTTSRELVEAALARIAETNDRWRVFISVDAENARRVADESDARRRSGTTIGPLDGVPVGIKDNIDVAGVVTTNGMNLPRQPASRDAAAAARLRRAGAVLVGKLNMHEGALGATTDNPFWGRCENPRLLGHTPGGSSGGSAAAIAGDLVPVTLGTDTMGSARIPAAYCGVWGLKPTRCLVPARGLSPLSWTLDAIGPLAANAEDLAFALAAIAGRDPDDVETFEAPDKIEPRVPDVTMRGLRLGILPEIVGRVDCEPAVLATYRAAIETARHAGSTIIELDMEGWQPTEARLAGLLVSEAEAGAALGKDLDGHPEAFSASFRDMVNFGRRAPGERLAAAYRTLHRLRLDTLAALCSVDAILLPTAPQRPFRHGEAAPANQADFTALANIAGCPSVAFPLPSGDKGAPSSAQLVGRPWSEPRLIGMAKALTLG